MYEPQNQSIKLTVILKIITIQEVLITLAKAYVIGYASEPTGQAMYGEMTPKDNEIGFD